MSNSLSIAAPAAIAAGAYLNAKWQVGYDLRILKTIFASNWYTKKLDKQGRANIFYCLEEKAQNSKDAHRILLWYEGQTWTFKQAYDIVIKYGTWLKNEHDVAPKDIVALDFTNGPKFLWMILGLWSIGAKPALINYNLGNKPLLHCIRVSSAKIVFVDYEVQDKFTPNVQEALSKDDFHLDGGPVKAVMVGASTGTHIAGINGIREPDSSRAHAGIHQLDKVAALIYTSGTTGNPKPAIISWGKWLTSAAFTKHWLGLQQSDIYYTCMPMYHATATIMAVMPAVINGYTAAIGHRFSNKTFWPEVRASKATAIQYVGETCRYLLAASSQIDPVTGENLDQTHSVKIAFGNGLRPDVWDRFKCRFAIPTIAEFYSASEGSGAFWNISSNSHTAGAIGRAGTLIRTFLSGNAEIVSVNWSTESPARDPSNNNFCIRVPIGQPGELLYKLDAQDIKASYQGYFGNESASEAKILRDVFVKGDAYFRTGDTIRRDAEGRVFFVDRIGDTYRWRSENVSTNEVQEALGHHPAIEEANVYGIAVPHHDGNAGCAAITLTGRQEPTAELLGDLAVHVSKTLPKYAVPIFLRVCKDLESTGNNKQQKHGLRQQGVDPNKVGNGDKVFWLQEGRYVSFGRDDWDRLKMGGVKL